MKMILSLLLFVVFPAQAAEEPESGERLHAEHCMRCHKPDIYTRKNRIVNSYAQLAERVRQCELSNKLAWFDEEIKAVVDYLNTTYYKFDVK